MHSGVTIAGIYSDKGHDLAGPEDEYVVLLNTGTEAVEMRGWSLTVWKQADRSDHYRYLFPSFLSNGDPWELEPGGMILLYTGRGTNGATGSVGEARQIHLYQHRKGRIWEEPGDLVCLYDQRRNLLAWWELPYVHRTA